MSDDRLQEVAERYCPSVFHGDSDDCVCTLSLGLALDARANQEAMRSRKLREALQGLHDKVKRVGESAEFRSIATIAAIHGGLYHGESWESEMTIARAALRDEEPAERYCPVGCGAHEDPGPWHERGCARWREEPKP